jgi:acyl-CoA thioester hydrolase
MAVKPETTVELAVPFHDLDPMQVVWHGNYFRYFELARQRLFDERGVDLVRWAQQRGLLFPIVKTAVKYIQPLRYRDRFTVSARLREAHRRIALDFTIRRLPDGALCARATSAQVAVRAEDGGLCFTIPQQLQALLGGGDP